MGQFLFAVSEDLGSDLSHQRFLKIHYQVIYPYESCFTSMKVSVDLFSIAKVLWVMRLVALTAREKNVAYAIAENLKSSNLHRISH